MARIADSVGAMFGGVCGDLDAGCCVMFWFGTSDLKCSLIYRMKFHTVTETLERRTVISSIHVNDWLCCVARGMSWLALIDWGAAMVARLPRDALLDSPGPVTLFSCNGLPFSLGSSTSDLSLPHPTHLALSIAADCPGDSPYFEICSVSSISIAPPPPSAGTL